MRLFAVIFCVFIALNVFADQHQWLRGIFRVNTNVSAGDESIGTVADKAQKAKLDFVVFSDQFLVIAEYGLPPFRNVFKMTRERPSVVSYGIEKYLDEIAKTQAKHPGITLIPGVDIAPHYYWTGSLRKGDLTTNQWSEQLTVFGDDNPLFYKKMPVSLNREWGVFFPETIIDLLPTLLVLLGVLAYIAGKKNYYSDCQGHEYKRPGKRLRLLFAFFVTALGAVWLVDNSPFRKDLGYSLYKNAGYAPFQKAIDYIKSSSPQSGIIWSAPEAEMKDQISGVRLYTAPYLEDIEKTSGYDGFAGIYGDASTAHEPGRTWDKLLIEYSSGKRKKPPTIVGESDYHGRKPIRLMQTIVRAKNKDRKEIVKALTSGRSYAIVEKKGKGVCLDKAYLSLGAQSAGLGDTLLARKNDVIRLNISGHISGHDKAIPLSGKLIVVSNGKKIMEKNIDLASFFVSEKINLKGNNLKKQYIRFYIHSRDAGWLLANPIFISLSDKDKKH